MDSPQIQKLSTNVGALGGGFGFVAAGTDTFTATPFALSNALKLLVVNADTHTLIPSNSFLPPPASNNNPFADPMLAKSNHRGLNDMILSIVAVMSGALQKTDPQLPEDPATVISNAKKKKGGTTASTSQESSAQPSNLFEEFSFQNK